MLADLPGTPVLTVFDKLIDQLMPTGLAFLDGALYVIAVDKLIKYENAEANLDNLGAGKVVYDDMNCGFWLTVGSLRRSYMIPIIPISLAGRPIGFNRCSPQVFG